VRSRRAAPEPPSRVAPLDVQGNAVLRTLGRAGLGLPLEAAHDASSTVHTVGAVTLHPHQVEAVARLLPLLASQGGALLADDVGLGKTFVALAVAARYAHVDVIAPAALRPMWRAAIAYAGHVVSHVAVQSLHAFSRGVPSTAHAAAPHRLVIVDEAHHLRNPATRRYAHVAAWSRGAHILLLSATPVHNRTEDLGHLLALFRGHAALTLPPAERMRLVVRRTAHELPRMNAAPRVRSVPALLVPDAPSVTRALARLPPPLPTREGRAAGALVALGLVRAWCSSASACLAHLQRRRLRAEALAGILAEGRWPSREELRAWTVAADAVQLGFTALLVGGPDVEATARGSGDVAAARRTLSRHLDALAELHTLVRATAGIVDHARAGILRRIRLRHPGEVILAFTQFAETVTGLGRLFRWDAGVATLTARGGRVAGGPLPRTELLARVAPLAHGRAPPKSHERITLLLATDLLSEGVNLQDARVVVHLDQPWTPAALAQREGRIARLGSRHDEVFAYTLRPPGGGADLLAIADRLRRKARAARVTLSPETPTPAADSPQAVRTLDAPGGAPSLSAVLAEWAARMIAPGSVLDDAVHVLRGPRVSATAGGRPGERRTGWLAAISHDDSAALVGGWFSGVATARPRTTLTREPSALFALVRLVDRAASSGRAPWSGRADHAHVRQGSPRVRSASEPAALDEPATRRLAAAARRAIARERRRLAAHGVAGALDAPVSRAQRVLRDLLARAPLRQRLALAPRVAVADRALRALRGAGDERALETLLARVGEPDVHLWLDAVVALAPAGPVVTASQPTRPTPPDAEVVTLLLLVP
jgi:hypothetical protein